MKAMRYQRKFYLWLVLGFVLALSWPVGAHRWAKKKVVAYQQELKAKGERVTITEMAPQPSPKGLRAATDFMRLIEQLRRTPFSADVPTMKSVAPGRCLVSWREDPLPTLTSSNVWPEVESAVQGNREVLRKLCRILVARSPAFSVNYSEGYRAALPHFILLKEAMRWLSSTTMLDLHEGHIEETVEDLLALVCFLEVQREEPLLLTTRFRIALATLACNATWQGLQSPRITAAHCAGLQKAWEKADLNIQLEEALQMERILSGMLFNELRNDPVFVFSPGKPGANRGIAELSEMAQGVTESPRAGILALARRYPQYWGWGLWQSWDDELAQMKALQVRVECVRRIRKGMPFKAALKIKNQDLNRVLSVQPNAFKWLNYRDNFKDGSADKLLPELANAEVQRILLITALALKRHQLTYGRAPLSLQELVPEFLVQAPRDPIDGNALRYLPAPDTGEYLLYSVGEDGEDQGGDSNPKQPGNAYQRSWYFARDAVWPWPASAD